MTEAEALLAEALDGFPDVYQERLLIPESRGPRA